MFEMFVIINYMLNVIYIIKINTAEFVFVLFNKIIGSIISNKFIGKFLDDICQYFKHWKNALN